MNTPKSTNKNWIFWSCLFILFCAAIYILKSVLLPFVAGIILGYLFAPWASYLEKRGFNRTLATFIVLLTAIVIIFPVLILLLSIIHEQIVNFLSIMPNYTSAFIKKIEPFLIEIQSHFSQLDPEQIKQSISSGLGNSFKLLSVVIQKIATKGFALFNLLSLLLITPVVTFYMLRDWKSFIDKIDSLLPRKSKKTIRRQAKEIDRTIAGFIRGQISVCLLLGTYYGLGLYCVGLDLGIVIGFLSGLLSFIPYVGSITGFILSILLAVAQFSTPLPIIMVVIVFITGQFIEGNFLTPKLVGDSVGLHPVWIMFALLTGGVLLGFLGLLIAVPTAAIIGVLIRHAIDNYKQSSLYLED